MIAAIDLGNSRLKVLRSDGRYAAWPADAIDWTNLNDLIAPAERLIVSSVNPQLEPLLREFLRKCPAVVDARDRIATGKLPIVIEARGIGSDRVLAVLGALQYRTPPFAVVDMGTALTATALDGQYHLRGGYIVPGVELQYRALRQAFPHLPVPSLASTWRFEPGSDTESAIVAGICLQTAFFLVGVQNAVAESCRVKQVFLFVTGGYSSLLPEDIFKQLGIEGAIFPHLVLTGGLSLLENS